MEPNLYRIPTDLGGGLIDTRPLIQPEINYKSAPISITSTSPGLASTINRTVKVVDEFGDPLPGAHVYFNQNTGVSTDFNGFASISGNGNNQITISYVGYKPGTYVFKSLPSKVKLEMDSDLGEVLITAPKKASTSDSQVPEYLFPAIGGIALLLIMMSMAGSSNPKEITL